MKIFQDNSSALKGADFVKREFPKSSEEMHNGSNFCFVLANRSK